MLPRLGECAQLFADIGKIVLCMGMIRIKLNSLAEVFPSRIGIPNLSSETARSLLPEDVQKLWRCPERFPD